MIHLFTWGLLIAAIVLGALLDKRLSAGKRQIFQSAHRSCGGGNRLDLLYGGVVSGADDCA